MTATLHSLSVRNFQSLHRVDLELLPFTVIVGPSSSGKSALTRAIKTLVSNRRGTEWITHGERVASVSATTDAGTVTLTRSRTQSSVDNAYTVTPAADPTAQQTYSKLGGDTPADVSRFLGIPSSGINFAGQFDKPYLLDDSTAEVARTLGALTNVSVIFEGARESNRRKLSAQQTLKLRSEDLQGVRDRVPEFKALRQQDEALHTAEELLARAMATEAEIARLTQALEIIEITEPTITRLEALASVEVPDEKPILQAQEALQSFQQSLAGVSTLGKAVQAAQEAYSRTEDEESRLLARWESLVGSATQDLHRFIEDMAGPGTIWGEYDQGSGQDVTWIALDEAVRVFLVYLETKAGA